jgi:hypothetical protein
MKNLYFIIAFLYIITTTFAQQVDDSNGEKEYYTLFGSKTGKTKVSGFGTLMLDFNGINKDFGLMMGGEGAVLINRSFFIGLYGSGLTTMPSYTYTYYSDTYSKEYNVNRKAAFAHGGLMFGVVFNATNPVHFGFTMRIGGGGVSLINDYMKDMQSSHKYFEYDDYPYVAPLFVMHPQLDFEMNLTNWMKFRISAGYQYVSSASLVYSTIENSSLVTKELLNTSMFSTPTVSMGFIFGWFK